MHTVYLHISDSLTAACHGCAVPTLNHWERVSHLYRVLHPAFDCRHGSVESLGIFHQVLSVTQERNTLWSLLSCLGSLSMLWARGQSWGIMKGSEQIERRTGCLMPYFAIWGLGREGKEFREESWHGDHPYTPGTASCCILLDLCCTAPHA